MNDFKIQVFKLKHLSSKFRNVYYGGSFARYIGGEAHTMPIWIDHTRKIFIGNIVTFLPVDFHFCRYGLISNVDNNLVTSDVKTKSKESSYCQYMKCPL